MYKINNQLSIEDFYFPYGKLKADNRWVKMANLVPWDEVECAYAAKFVNNGAPAHPARMALGALLAKQLLKCSDEELVCQVAENAYLQFFIGLKEFQEKCPFGASTLVAFRKRFSEEEIARINDAMLAAAAGTDDDGSAGGSDGGTTMALDATVAPSNISYPQDVKLLNEAREHLEDIIDSICAQTGAKKPRTYRKVARKDFLSWSKSKRRSPKKTRAALRRQLGYVGRDLRHIDALIEDLAPDLSERQTRTLDTLRRLFAQQLSMYKTRTHSVPNRIVSISQPWVRPMVRGKAAAATEFGAKVDVSCDEGGYARIERISFDAFNESEDLIGAAESYCVRTGRYPDRLLADKIYRTRKNLAWCKERNISLSGPKLGRPPKDACVSRKQKERERKDAAERNVVEGVFGTAKTAYGLDPVRTRLEETTKTAISLAILAFNLKKLLAASLSLFLNDLISRLMSAIRTMTSRQRKPVAKFQVVME